MDKEEQIINDLISKGGLEFVGIDNKTGEHLYKPTEKLKRLDPKLSQDLSLYFSDMSMKLWVDGFIDMDVTLSDPLVKLTKKSLNIKELEAMEKNERIVLEQIIKTLAQQK